MKIVLLLLLVSCSVKSSLLYDHLRLGMPSSCDLPNQKLLTRQQYVSCYDKDLGGPRWVSWVTTETDYGKAKRSNHFISEGLLPTDWPKVTYLDYLSSGYDRGHLVPSEERTDSQENNNATFILSNILPQTHDLNAGPWKQLESFIHRQCSSGKIAYQVSGGLYVIDSMKLNNLISVPAYFFKVVVLVDKNGEIGKNVKVISVLMPNITGIMKSKWRDYQVNVRTLEQKLNFDFDRTLSSSIQDEIENRIDVFE